MRPRPPLVRTVLLLAGAFVAAGVLALGLVRIGRVVVAPGAFTGPSQPVRAARAGVIAAVVVESGARVEQGALLARLDSAALAAERAELAAQRAGEDTRRAEAERERHHLLETLQPAERESLARGEHTAQLVLENARTKEQRTTQLEAAGLAEKTELESAVLERQLAEVDLERVRASLANLPALEREALAALDARLAEGDSALAALAAREGELAQRLAQSELVAPVAGRVLAPPARELVGRAVAAGEELMRVATPGVEAFLARLDDRGRARAREGQSARLRLEGYPWLVHGTIDARVALVSDRKDEQGWLVRLEIDPAHAPGPLFEGMSGTARIDTAERVSLLWLIVEELFELGPR